MQFNHFIGVDVSKTTLDCVLLQHGKAVFHQKVANSKAGIKALIKALVAKHKLAF